MHAFHHIHIIVLVGGIPTPLKNTKVHWDDEIPYGKIIQSCSRKTTNQSLINIPILSTIKYY